ncbi:hypothetical protein [Microvirga brassicacearum]|uniref:Uncharacterized protein n=1 Tax=Microvirga brassicacearum TaxID=2580413 RepID=A0A5N3PHL7_9HYPH|nr:hypothetical protein [Microvirga brassicacearum]KAB0269217.1 hypothetical protein FEZ63_03715 [Microvirga brassicacearum]
MIFLNLHAGPIFLNLHAGPISSHTAANPSDVVFVLWTDEKPVAAPFAVAKGDWMMATRFADLVHAIPAGEVIVILDTCEAGAVSPLFIDENPHDDERRPESVITSSGAGQFANFAADH